LVLVTVLGADCVANGASALASIVDQVALLGERTSVLYDGAYADHLPTKPSNVQFESAGAACLCCIGGPVLRTQIIRCLRQDKPQRIVVVGGLAAQLSAIVDALLTALLREHIKVDQVVWAQSNDVQPWVSTNSVAYSAVNSFANSQLEAASKVVMYEPGPPAANSAKKQLLSPHLPNLNWAPPWHPLSNQNQTPNSDASMEQMIWPNSSVFNRVAAIQTIQNLQAELAQPVQVVLRTERAWYFGQTQTDQLSGFRSAQWVWRETSFRQFSAVRITRLNAAVHDTILNSKTDSNFDKKMYEWRAGLDGCRHR
jgi:hypothetical protein